MIQTKTFAPFSNVKIDEDTNKVPRGFRVGALSAQPGGLCRYVIRNRDGASVLCRESPCEDDLLPLREMARELHTEMDTK